MSENTEQARSFEEQVRQLREENAALRQASEASAESAKQAKEMAERIQRDAETKRFTDEVLGRSEQNSTRWYLGPTTAPGEDGKTAVERQVNTLRTLASTFGEDSPEFKSYVEQQRAVAETVRHSNVFSVAGMTGDGNPANAESRLMAFAEAERKARPELSPEQATLAAMEAHPDLYAEFERERESRLMRR